MSSLLLWKEFASNTRETFHQLWKESAFTDVTLATEDGQQVAAHRLILSSCSQLFKDILAPGTEARMVVYLKDIRTKDLQNVLKFMYTGECEVAEEDLDDFLTTGRDLKLKGLLDPMVINDDKAFNKLNFKTENTKPQDALEHNTVPSEQSMKITNNQVEEVSNQSLFTTSVNPKKTTVNSESYVASFNWTYMDGKYMCNQCTYKAPNQGKVAIHIQAKHEGVRYSCDKCDYKSTHQNHMTMHKRRKHE